MDVICIHDYGLSKENKTDIDFSYAKKKKVENWYYKFFFHNFHSKT